MIAGPSFTCGMKISVVFGERFAFPGQVCEDAEQFAGANLTCEGGDWTSVAGRRELFANAGGM